MASASTSDDVCEWQLTKNTVGERIKHMYRNPLMADVHFTVTDGQGSSSLKVNIPCHKFILAISSPVFYKMFYGELKEASDYIDLPDCDSEGFLEFLRFIYCDEVELTGSCVIQVLYLAKKYMIPSLANRCRSFLEANVNAENVLDLLPTVEKMEEIHLNDVCWNVIDTRTAKVFESAPDAILEDKNLLASILQRDTLDVEEVEVFQAVNRWAEAICAKRGKTPSGQEKSAIIGEEVMKLIRFPSMPLSLFGEHVVDTKILTDTEIIEIFMYFSVTRIAKGFSCFPRCLNSSNLLRCNRLEHNSRFWSRSLPCSDDSRQNISRFPESTSFSVNVPILLGGITISGSRREEYTVKLKLNGKVVSEGCFLSEGRRAHDGNFYTGFDIIFK
ncbi:BTB/POZ domain-containing protein 6-A-like [Stylophora pistillata]|nr:BTB/POZ domain-containing protein 6-A-like [Stylophora pistillata]